MGNVFHLIPPDRVQGTARRCVVDTMAVSAGDDGRIVGGLGPAFDLDAVHTGVHQFLQVVDHAHIPGVQDIAAFFVLKNGEILSRPLFFHQGVLVPAGLCAGAPVGVPAGHIVAQQTPAGVADTHGAVPECLDFQLLRNALPDTLNLLQTQLPGQHHSFGTQIKPGRRTGVVGH